MYLTRIVLALNCALQCKCTSTCTCTCPFTSTLNLVWSFGLWSSSSLIISRLSQYIHENTLFPPIDECHDFFSRPWISATGFFSRTWISAIGFFSRTWMKDDLFKASALWADAFYKSICPSVCVFVCLSVCLSVCSLLRYRLAVFLPPLPEVGCPIFLQIRNP